MQSEIAYLAKCTGLHEMDVRGAEDRSASEKGGKWNNRGLTAHKKGPIYDSTEKIQPEIQDIIVPREKYAKNKMNLRFIFDYCF